MKTELISLMNNSEFGSDLPPVLPSGFDAEDDLHPGLLPPVQLHGHRQPRRQFGL